MSRKKARFGGKYRQSRLHLYIRRLPIGWRDNRCRIPHYCNTYFQNSSERRDLARKQCDRTSTAASKKTTFNFAFNFETRNLHSKFKKNRKTIVVEGVYLTYNEIHKWVVLTERSSSFDRSSFKRSTDLFLMLIVFRCFKAKLSRQLMIFFIC